MESPIGDKLFLLGGIFGLAELCRIRGAIWELKRPSPMAVLVMLDTIIRVLAPTVNESEETYDLRRAFYSVFYAVPAAFCLRYWSRNSGRIPVFLAYALFCVALVIAGWFMINAPGADRIITSTNESLSRNNPEEMIHYLGFFKIDDVIIGVIPFAIFAMSGDPAVITPRCFWPKLILLSAAFGGFWLNLAVVTESI